MLQGATPKTEDQLEEDTQLLMQLGSDAEASQLRAKIMSASLLSDMESFKVSTECYSTIVSAGLINIL